MKRIRNYCFFYFLFILNSLKIVRFDPVILSFLLRYRTKKVPINKRLSNRGLKYSQREKTFKSCLQHHLIIIKYFYSKKIFLTMIFALLLCKISWEIRSINEDNKCRIKQKLILLIINTLLMKIIKNLLMQKLFSVKMILKKHLICLIW